MNNLINNLKEDFRNNPIPTVIAGLGLASTIGQTLQSALRKPQPPTFGARCSSAAEHARESLVHAADAAKERVQCAAESVAEKAGEVKNSLAGHSKGIEDSVVRTKQTAEQLVQTNPYLWGAGIAASGFVIGLLIPPSRAEREWFGAKGRQLIDDAKAAGREVVEEGKALAKETVAAADQAVREAAEDAGESVRDQLASV